MANEIQASFYLRICDILGNTNALQGVKGKKSEISADLRNI